MWCEQGGNGYDVSGTNYNAMNTYNLLKKVNTSRPYHANNTAVTRGGNAWTVANISLSTNQLTFTYWISGGVNTMTFQRWYLHAYAS